MRISVPGTLLLVGLVPMFAMYFLRIHDMPSSLMQYIAFSSARFAEDGFFYHRFTPPFYDVWSDYSPTGFTVWYTHYPPLPFYIGGVIWLLGGTTKATLCAVFNAVALGYVLVFYRVFSLLFNRWIACLSALILASHPLFIEQVLENYLNLSLFFQSAAFLLLVLALESPSKRKRYLLYSLAWIGLFADAFSSFDQILASGFLVFAYTLWRLGFKQWKRVVRIVGIMATASISAFLIHLLANAWFFGSFGEAFQDLCVNALQNKSVRDNIPYQNEFSLKEYPFWLAQRVWLRYGLTAGALTAVAIALSWVLVTEWRSSLVRRYFAIAGVMGIANLAYWTAFPRLNYLQFGIANGAQLLPTYSILLGGAVYFMAFKLPLCWSQIGLRKLLVVVPWILVLTSLVRVSSQTIESAQIIAARPVDAFSRDVLTNATVRVVGELSDTIPEKSILAITNKAAFGTLLRLTPRTAYGLRDLPFSVQYLKASDKNSLYKLESLALSRKVYILRTFDNPGSAQQRRDALIEAFAEAGVPRDKWEDAITDLSPIPVRSSWELVTRANSWELYRVRPPEQDDLFPHRALLPTRLAISGARMRDGHELQLIGWVYSPARITRVEISLDGEKLGSAIYPAPGNELAAKNFSQARQWFGMQDYPLPDEKLPANYPEYEDNTPRFIFLRRDLKLAPSDHTVTARAYSGTRLVAEATYAMEYVRGSHTIRDYFSAEVSPHVP
jgi:hypothetical protein